MTPPYLVAFERTASRDLACSLLVKGNAFTNCGGTFTDDSSAPFPIFVRRGLLFRGYSDKVEAGIFAL